VVRAQPGGRGDRVAGGRRRRGRRGRRDELLPHRARRRGEAARDPGERRDRPALSRPRGLLDARAGERGRGRGDGSAAHRHLPERGVAPDLREPARLGRPAAAAAVGAPAARRRRRAVRARAAGQGGRVAPPEARGPRDPRARGASAGRLRGRSRRARAPRRGGVRQPLRARCGVLRVALPRLAARLSLLRRVPRGQAPRRRRRRAHVQARRLGRLPGGPRRCAGGERRRPRSPLARGRRGEGRRGRARPASAPLARRAASAPASGFAPTNKQLRFIGKPLREGAELDRRKGAWHFTLGDFDFF
jgi:hypothetical protein